MEGGSGGGGGPRRLQWDHNGSQQNWDDDVLISHWDIKSYFAKCSLPLLLLVHKMFLIGLNIEDFTFVIFGNT